MAVHATDGIEKHIEATRNEDDGAEELDEEVKSYRIQSRSVFTPG
jgi:hypothetical protein